MLLLELLLLRCDGNDGNPDGSPMVPTELCQDTMQGLRHGEVVEVAVLGQDKTLELREWESFIETSSSCVLVSNDRDGCSMAKYVESTTFCCAFLSLHRCKKDCWALLVGTLALGEARRGFPRWFVMALGACISFFESRNVAFEVAKYGRAANSLTEHQRCAMMDAKM